VRSVNFHLHFSPRYARLGWMVRISGTFPFSTRVKSDDQIIRFRCPITVNVTTMNFCSQYGICNDTSIVDVVLGAAQPARTFPLIDNDGVVRYYPQAVVRQMKFPQNLQISFASTDILIEFNSNVNFYYQRPNTNNATIQSDQYDFLTVATHE
jgi:hypothetical protein